MAKRTGTCSECPKALYNVQSKVCSPKCRSRRARRIKRNRAAGAEKGAEARTLPPELGALRMTDELRDVAREELRPVVREAITADVLAAAGKLVGLTEIMVNAIEEDLRQTTDLTLRQKAYSLLARYTLGNASIAPTPQEADKAPMQVVFQLPRPGDDPSAAPVQIAATELRECVECTVHKPADEMVGASDRCQACQDTLDERVRSRFTEQ